MRDRRARDRFLGALFLWGERACGAFFDGLLRWCAFDRGRIGDQRAPYDQLARRVFFATGGLRVTTNEEKPGIVKKGVAAIGLLVSATFLVNLPMFPPEIPDVLPVVGNVDELLASAVLLWSARTLGIKPVLLMRARRQRKRLEAGKGPAEG